MSGLKDELFQLQAPMSTWQATTVSQPQMTYVPTGQERTSFMMQQRQPQWHILCPSWLQINILILTCIGTANGYSKPGLGFTAKTLQTWVPKGETI